MRRCLMALREGPWGFAQKVTLCRAFLCRMRYYTTRQHRTWRDVRAVPCGVHALYAVGYDPAASFCAVLMMGILIYYRGLIFVRIAAHIVFDLLHTMDQD